MKQTCLHSSPFLHLHILNEVEEIAPVEKVEDNIFELSPSLLPELEKKITSMNKKAAKIGVPPVSIENLGSIVKEMLRYSADDQALIAQGLQPEGTKKPVKIKLVKIKVNGQRPQVAGYDFLATVEGKASGNVMRVAPGAEGYQKELQAYYNSDPGLCEWCKKRRRRTETFIVRDVKTGELKQVGRNCLKDFLGGKSPQAVASMFAWYEDLYSYLSRAGGEGDGGGMGGMRSSDPVVDPAEVLLMGTVAARLYGYKPSSFEGGNTAYMTRMFVFGPPPKYIKVYNRSEPNPEYAKYEEMKAAISDADKQQVKAIVDWFSALPDEKKKEPYFHNVGVLLKEPAVASKDVGYLVGLIPTFMRSQGQQWYQKADAKSNEWVGSVGQKIPATKVNVVRTRKMDSGFYGAPPTQIVNMEDEKGNVITWFNNSREQMEEGKTYMITGTVKKQDDYKGRKQTVITRAKFQSA